MKAILKICKCMVNPEIVKYEFILDVEPGTPMYEATYNASQSFSDNPPELRFPEYGFIDWMEHRFEEPMMHVCVYRHTPGTYAGYENSIIFDAPDNVRCDYGPDGWPTAFFNMQGDATAPGFIGYSHDMDIDINCLEFAAENAPLNENTEISNFIEWLWPDLAVGRA